jgi:hypothetical protein
LGFVCRFPDRGFDPLETCSIQLAGAFEMSMDAIMKFAIVALIFYIVGARMPQLAVKIGAA